MHFTIMDIHAGSWNGAISWPIASVLFINALCTSAEGLIVILWPA